MDDPSYNFEEAAKMVKTFASARIAETVLLPKILHAATMDTSKFFTAATNVPGTYQLYKDVDGQHVDTTFRLVGVLFDKFLAPPRITKSVKNKLNLQQSVHITGLGSATFADAAKKMTQVKENIKDELSGLAFSPERLNASNFQEHPGLFASNRYFSSRMDSPAGVEVPFGTGFDPADVLYKLKGAQLFHSADNVVAYYEQTKNEEGRMRMKQCTPMVFANGDIVECTVSILVVQLKAMAGHDPLYTVITRLKALSKLHGPIIKKTRVTPPVHKFKAYEEQASSPLKGAADS
ncbi:hypothetical protein C8R44DRAFT_888067 [Mycena epipterygia]|nr:hypothetical protein C8R44DRAFT_888067 [Mycena epipterygia]